MEYVLLIHAAEQRFATASPAEVHQVLGAYGSFTKELFASGKAGDCAALEATATATSLRVRQSKRAVSDGPFAETREQLGGYYVVKVENEADALTIAARIPDAEGGSIEVRPVMEVPDVGPEPALGQKPADATKEYLLMLYEEEANWTQLSEEAAMAMMMEYKVFSDAITASGHYVAGAPLQPAATAKIVRLKKGDRAVTDGPYAETREQLGGYYRIWARDLDEALAIAARVPTAKTGTVEIRPIADTSAYA